MKFNKKQKEIMEKLIKNKLSDYVEFNNGSGCFKIKKITDKYVIFNGCFDKTEVKYYFDLEDFDDVGLLYILRKNKKGHLRIDMNTSVYVEREKKKKLTKKEKEELVMEHANLFGRIFMSDVMETYSLSPKEVRNIFNRLDERGLLKEEK